MKVCNTCRVEKRLDEFHKFSNHGDGYRNKCRECQNKYQKQRFDERKTTFKINWRGKKPCILCLRKLPNKSFSVKWDTTSGLGSSCKDCQNIWKSYKINYHDRQAMLLAQESKCYICGKVENGEKLHVDHLHRNGVAKDRCEKKDVRGLLCSQCNTGLGLFKEDPAIFARALEYLIDPPAQKVLRD